MGDSHAKASRGADAIADEITMWRSCRPHDEMILTPLPSALIHQLFPVSESFITRDAVVSGESG